jgi:hypothetical protein
MLRLELEFERLNVIEMQEVLDVQMLQQEEQALMQACETLRDQNFTTAHIKAAKKIMRAMIRRYRGAAAGVKVPEEAIGVEREVL